MSHRCRTIGPAGLVQTAARWPPSACRGCRTLDASGHATAQTSCINAHTCLQPAMGSQWLRVLLQLPTPGEGAPLWDSGISLWTLRSSPARPQLVLGVLATVPGAPTLVAKRLANASAFDKASFPNRADTDEMALQAKGTLEEVDCGTPPVRRGGVCGKHQELKTVRTDAFARRSRIRW